MVFFFKRLGLISFIFLVLSCSNNPTQSVYFVNLNEGDSVKSPFLVEFGIAGMKVGSAGEVKTGYGHHHLLINKDSVPEGAVIPSDKNHLHFGLGQTSTKLNLESGEYSLTLQFGDGQHISYGDEMSQTINLSVK